MPDTHYKWVQANSQQINGPRTVMIGGLHHLLSDHSLTGAGLPPQENSADALAAGLKYGFNTPATLPQSLEVRASHMLGTLPREQISEFLSGLLIGAEVASMRGYVTHQHVVILVVGTSLTVRYQQAFQAMGCDVTAIVGDAAFQAGIRSIAHAVVN